VGISFDFPEKVGIDLSADGPALSFMELKDNGNGAKWQITHTWVSAAANLGLVFVINQQIESLWSVATRRYVGSQRSFGLFKISPEIVETVSQAGIEQKPITIQNFGMPLAYYVDPEAEPDLGEPVQP
jgi:hypothetical protein